MSMCESILTIALVCTVKYLHYCDYYYTLGNDSQSTPKLIAYEESDLLPVIDIINNSFDGSYNSFIESLIDHKKDFDEKELDDLQKFINHKCQEIQQQQAEIHS